MTTTATSSPPSWIRPEDARLSDLLEVLAARTDLADYPHASRVEQEAALVGVQAVADRTGPGHRQDRIEPAGLCGLQVRSLVGQQADRQYGEQEQPERRDRQRGVQPPPEACRDARWRRQPKIASSSYGVEAIFG